MILQGVFALPQSLGEFWVFQANVNFGEKKIAFKVTFISIHQKMLVNFLYFWERGKCILLDYIISLDFI